MYSSLQEFYNSKDWFNLRQSIIMERINDKGQTICEHCGEPIYNKYDCIAHHVIELTPANVNDYNISLNPDNIKLLHHHCHNDVHSRFGFKQKKVYLVIGSVCSGKSTFVKEAAGHNDIILDMDSIWEAISNNERYHKPNSIKNVALAIRETMIEQISMRNFDSNAYVLSTESRAMQRKRLIQRINADEVIFMDTTKEECYKRLYSDPQREPYIKEHSEFIEKFFNQLSFNENEHNYILK